MAPAGQVALLWGGRRIELDASALARRGGLRALEREAQEAFGLQPGSFALHCLGGRVDSPEALCRALQSAGDVCALQLREHPEWRELNAAAAALEARVMAKVEGALAGLREGLARAEGRLDCGLAPMVQALAMEQLDLRSSVDALRGLPPLVQSLAMEQIGARDVLGAGRAAVPEAAPPAQPSAIASPQLVVLCTPPPSQAGAGKDSPEAGAAALKDLEDLEKQLRQDLGGRLSAVEQADEFLFSEMQAMQDCSKAVRKDVEQLQSDLQGLEQKHNEREQAAQDPSGPRSITGGVDARMSWSEGLPAAIPYSGKVLADFQKGAHGKRGWTSGIRAGVMPPEGPAPFARGASLRLERTPGCQSLPLLPPLR